MDDLITALQTASSDKVLLREFLRDLLTPMEYRDTALRWRIITMLASHTPQRDIAKSLGVSLSKITRGSRELMDPTGGFSQILQQTSRD